MIGKIATPIHRKSEFTAYTSDGIEYMSRVEHCSSCLSDQYDGYEDIYSDYCCCVHSQFQSKKHENTVVKESGFWHKEKTDGAVGHRTRTGET